MRPGGFTPASVMPRTGRTEAELERGARADRRASRRRTLLEDIAFARGPSPAGAWATVARHPRRWLPRYAEALRKAWRGVRRPWADAAELFEREVARVGTASARGAGAELLSSIHPRARVEDGRWLLPGSRARDPAGPGARAHADPDPGRLRLSLRRAARRRHPRLDRLPVAEAWDEPAAEAGVRLEALIGPSARCVLRELERPAERRRAGEGADRGAERGDASRRRARGGGAGVRERHGRRVIVHRTPRGTHLVGLSTSRGRRLTAARRGLHLTSAR